MTHFFSVFNPKVSVLQSDYEGFYNKRNNNRKY